ncbi:MAG: signal peptidase I [Spirochaetes bacterium]|nr:signal peptidase I [Spirochaetota bacterium]
MLSYRDSRYERSIKILVALGFALAGILAGFILSRAFIIPYMVRGDSMHPGFRDGQRILCLRFGTPRFGDVILMDDPVDDDAVFAKRVIGVAGDSIEIKNQVIYRNSRKMSFPWRTSRRDTRNLPMGFTNRDTMPMVKLMRDEYFVLNDNLDDGYDSRAFGKIGGGAVRGRMVYAFK